MDGFFLTFDRGLNLLVQRWLGLAFWEQEATKIIGLTILIFFTIMILGDIYRGEIQNRHFKIKLISFPGANAAKDKELMWVPKDLTNQNIDQIKSSASFYLFYRDAFGKDRRRLLHTYDVRFKVRYARFQALLAADQGSDHRRETLEEEEGAESIAPRAEIVALDRSRASHVSRERKALFTKLEEEANQLRSSRLARWLRLKRQTDILDPKTYGIEVRFHFPINPYFLLYKHPDRDLRSTAWLTVLTSMFALLMQILFGYQD